MAQTISQRIALEGGEEIRRQLEAIAKSGKVAFSDIEKAAVEAAASLNKFVQAVAGVERSFAAVGASARNFGVALGGVGRGFSAFESALGRSLRNVTFFAGALAAGQFGLLKFVTAAAKSADEIAEQAAGLGITTEAYQKLAAVAEDSGISQNQFGRALGNLNKIIAKDAQPALEAASNRVRELGLRFPPTAAGAEAAARAVGRFAAEAQKLAQSDAFKQRGIVFADSEQGRIAADNLRKTLGLVQSEADKTGSALRKLGISTVDASGKVKSADTVLLEFADAIKKLPDGAQKSALVMEALGTLVGRRFVDFLNRGSDGIRKFAEQAARLRFTPEQIETADDYNKALLVLQNTGESVLKQLALLFGPSLTQLFAAATSSILSNFESLRAGVEGIVNQIRPTINDLIILLTGPEDESQLELKSVDSWRASITAFGEAVRGTVEIVKAAFAGLLAAANAVASVLNTVFGTQLSGGALLAAAAILKFLGVFGLLITGLRLAGSLALALARGLGLLVSLGSALGRVVGLLRFLPIILAGIAGLPALIVAGIIAATAAIITFWDEIKSGAAIAIEAVRSAFTTGLEFIGMIFASLGTAASAAWEAIKAAFSTGIDAIRTGWNAIPAAAAAAWETLRAGAASAWEGIRSIVEGSWQGIVSFLTSAAQGLASVWSTIVAGATGAWNAIAAGASALGTRISGALSSAISFITAPFQSIVSRIGQIFSSVTSAAADLANQIKALISAGLDISSGVDVAAKLIAPFQAAAQQIQGIWQGIGQFVADIFLQLSGAIDQTVQKIEQAADRALRALERVLDVAREAAQTAGSIDVGGGGDGFARGGLVRGPGSRTSDSIPAWLSNREYVVNARAVEHYGVGLLSAINSMRFRVPKFSLGGLADSMSRSFASLAVPRFADGGLVDFGGPAAGLRPLTVVIDNGGSRQAFAGLLAPADVADNMVRFAVSSQRAALGRKPSCY